MALSTRTKNTMAIAMANRTYATAFATLVDTGAAGTLTDAVKDSIRSLICNKKLSDEVITNTTAATGTLSAAARKAISIGLADAVAGAELADAIDAMT